MKSKSIYLAIFSLFIFNFSISQVFQGKAYYQSKTNMSGLNLKDEKLDPEMAKMIEEQLNKSMEKTFILNFSKLESNYEEEKKLENGNSEGFFISMGSDVGKIYKNLKTKMMLSENQILGREFLVSNDLANFDWQIKDETKKIGDYLCQKAICVIPVSDKEKKSYEDFMNQKLDQKTKFIMMDEPKDKQITVWFCSEIPVSNGPNEYWGLPGLILEASFDKTTILCTKIVLNLKDKMQIEEPKNGKKISQKEFNALMEKQMEQFKSGNENGKYEINIER